MVIGHYPTSIEEACGLLSTYEKAVLVSGGTDVMVVKKQGDHMIFLSHIPALKEVTLQEGALWIGAGATYAELLRNALIPDVLKEVISQIASPALRHVGTIGGNICNASPAGDMLPILYALDAEVMIASLGEGQVNLRLVPIETFILGVRRIALDKKELVVALQIKEESYRDMGHILYEKVGARKAEAIAKVSFVGLGKVEENKVKDLRLAFGAVGTTVIRCKDLEGKYLGQDVEMLKREKANLLQAYKDRLHPIDDQRSTAQYRKTISLRLLQVFLEALTGEEESP